MYMYEQRPAADVIFIPYYLEAGLKANGLSVEEFLAVSHRESTVDVESIYGKLSMNDLTDMVTLNAVVLASNFGLGDSGVQGSLTDFAALERLFNYVQRTADPYDKERVIRIVNDLSSVVPGNGGSDNTYFSMTHNKNQVHVVVYKGFTDFIKFNNREFVVDFHQETLDFMFKTLPDTAIFNSILFKNFIRLTNQK